MPNLSTHPARTPRDPCKGYVGEIGHSTLENSALYNPDIIRSAFYQDGFQKFSNIPVDRNRDIEIRIRQAIAEASELETFRKLYGEILDGRGVIEVETRLVRLMLRKMDALVVRSIKEAFDNADADSVEMLLAEFEKDPLLAAQVKTMDLSTVKEKLPALRDAQVAKERGRWDEGSGARRKSSVMLTRRSIVSQSLFTKLSQAKIKGWEHVTFNAQNGRLGILKDIVFDKRKSIYRKDVPDAEFADPDEVREVLEEVVEIWNIFQVRIYVVQAHKSPYASKMVDGGDHDTWMQLLATKRAEKITQVLEELGIPSDMMTPQVQVVSQTPTMQYILFDLALQHTEFEYVDGIINLKTDLPFARRKFYDGGHYENPRAEFADPTLANDILLEVVKIWSVYKCDVEIVVLRTPVSEGTQQQHELWLQEVMQHRGEKALEELVGLGVPRERLATHCGDAASKEDVGILRFELLRDMRPDPPKDTAPESGASVEGCGQTDFNGKYKPVGTQNGQIRYRHENCGKPTLAFCSDDFWHLCYNFDKEQSFYKSRDLNSTTQWKASTREFAGGLLPTVRIFQVPPTEKEQDRPQLGSSRSNVTIKSKAETPSRAMSLSKSVSGLSDVKWPEVEKVTWDQESEGGSVDGAREDEASY